ncbi:unnamed protein product [Protopolystoma xenopodis]|uniref:Uncharacterized protein n=1 Tax=Protopolystoma xenopodis TaxID=117903 RepID=A0A3S5B0M5_9PLAT|nr:unnamed protein product [Protopolystoma xenopodis]
MARGYKRGILSTDKTVPYSGRLLANIFFVSEGDSSVLTSGLIDISSPPCPHSSARPVASPESSATSYYSPKSHPCPSFSSSFGTLTHPPFSSLPASSSQLLISTFRVPPIAGFSSWMVD